MHSNAMNRPSLPVCFSVVLIVAVLTGCSGLGGSSKLTCPLPEGSHCDSVSNTYAGATRGELAGQRRRNADTEATAAATPSGMSALMTNAPRSQYQAVSRTSDGRQTSVGMPLRSAPRIVRIWIKPWEDSDGDLHDQSFVYLAVTEGEWAVGQWQREVREAYAPVRAQPASASASTSPPAAGGSSGG